MAKNIGLYTEKLYYAKRENWRGKWRAKKRMCENLKKKKKTEVRHANYNEQAPKKLIKAEKQT